jgi:hypothetical protein
MRSRDYLGRAYAWQVQGQWFHGSSVEGAPEDALLAERYLICGQIVLRLLLADGRAIVRGAKPHLQ